MRDGLFRFYPLFLEKGPPMRKEIPVKEYLSLRPADLKKPEYRHVWLLLFWAIEVPLFFLTEKLPLTRHVIYCALDDRIPFCEALILPYVLWFGCCVFVTVYTLLRDVPVFVCAEVNPGDLCLVVFADCDVDAWLETGEAGEPASGRMHSLSDAFAFVGFRRREAGS